MGRYAQRRRSGGGPQSTLYIVRARTPEFNESLVVWSSAVSVSDLANLEFTSQPSGFVVDSVIQFNPHIQLFEWADDIDGDTHLRMTQVTPDGRFIPFQEIAYSDFA